MNAPAPSPTPTPGPLLPARIALPTEAEGIEPLRAQVRALPMTELEKEGVGLANMVLWIIAALAVLLLGLIAKSEFHDVPAEAAAAQQLLERVAAASAPASAEVLEKALQAQQRVADARQASRTFWKDVIQTLLVNIFLPVLTAVLGYIFGTSRSANGSGKGS